MNEREVLISHGQCLIHAEAACMTFAAETRPLTADGKIDDHIATCRFYAIGAGEAADGKMNLFVKIASPSKTQFVDM